MGILPGRLPGFRLSLGHLPSGKGPGAQAVETVVGILPGLSPVCLIGEGGRPSCGSVEAVEVEVLVGILPGRSFPFFKLEYRGADKPLQITGPGMLGAAPGGGTRPPR